MKKSFVIVSLVLGLSSQQTFAEENENISHNISLGIKLGQSKLSPISKLRMKDDNDTTYGIALDYFFSNSVALGIGYVDFGEAIEDGDIISSASGTTLSITYQEHYENSQWGTLIRAGFIDWQIKESFSAVSNEVVKLEQQSNTNYEGLDPFYEFGIFYDLSDDIQLALMADWYKMPLGTNLTIVGDSTSDIPLENKYTSYTVGISYRF
jgi:outer membrane protein with beta-barrel domain